MKLMVALLTLLLSSEALGCKLAESAYDLGAFLSESKPNAVVFTGQVLSVKSSKDGKTHEILLKAQRWWRGQPRDEVVAVGQTGTGEDTSCGGVFDFTARAGSSMLIVGEEQDGTVYPSRLLSRELKDSELPRELSEAL